MLVALMKMCSSIKPISMANGSKERLVLKIQSATSPCPFFLACPISAPRLARLRRENSLLLFANNLRYISSRSRCSRLVRFLFMPARFLAITSLRGRISQYLHQLFFSLLPILTYFLIFALPSALTGPWSG